MKPDQVELLDAAEPHDPITEKIKVGAPFLIHGMKVKTDTRPMLMLIAEQSNGRSKVFFIDAPDQATFDADAFIDVTAPIPLDPTIFTIDVPGPVHFTLMDFPARQLKKAPKVLQEFSLEVIA